MTLQVGSIQVPVLSSLQLFTSSIASNITFTQNVTILASTFIRNYMSTGFMTATSNLIEFTTSNVDRMVITSTGLVGIGTINPSILLDVAGATRTSSLETSTTVSLLQVSTPTLLVSSVTGTIFQTVRTSSLQMTASTFTGRWNDAQFYVLQTI